jgi:DNA-directed RNA polymerase subunit K
MEKPKMEEFTKYERTRILGARALQVAMDAPLLIGIKKEQLESIRYEPMEIANIELESGALPITVRRPMPQKKAMKLKKIVAPVIIEEKKENKEKQLGEKDVSEMEEEEEKEISEEGEIMELANPEDEDAGEEVGGREGSEELQ